MLARILILFVFLRTLFGFVFRPHTQRKTADFLFDYGWLLVHVRRHPALAVLLGPQFPQIYYGDQLNSFGAPVWYARKRYGLSLPSLRRNGCFENAPADHSDIDATVMARLIADIPAEFLRYVDWRNARETVMETVFRDVRKPHIYAEIMRTKEPYMSKDMRDTITHALPETVLRTNIALAAGIAECSGHPRVRGAIYSG